MELRHLVRWRGFPRRFSDEMSWIGVLDQGYLSRVSWLVER